MVKEKPIKTDDLFYPASRVLHPVRRSGFTLVELLVVITIIAILAGLITAAAIGAVRTAKQASLKTEVDQISGAFEKYKDGAGSYPPNAMIDDATLVGGDTATTPIDESKVLSDMRMHLKTAFQNSKESDNLARVLCGLPATGTDAGDFPKILPGGMTAAEATVFWLTNFSSKSSYPISGPNGASYAIQGQGQGRTLDPLEVGKWTHPFKVEQLYPRDSTDGYFDSTSDRFIEYQVRINGQPQWRRINFWRYNPGKSKEPVLYFDTSRNPAALLVSGNVIGPYDPPAATDLSGMELHVHALKKRASSSGTGVPIEFANAGKFQVLHCGIDDAWGADILERTSVHGVASPANANSYLLYPDGPFAGEAADTVVNFITPAKLEDVQQ